MATLVSTNAYVLINAVDLSDHVKQVTLDYQAELVDFTAMGADTRVRKGGLKDWTLTVEFFEDYAASKVDATLFPIVGSAVTVEVRAVNSARSSTNPGYNGSAVLESMPAVAGNIGEAAMAQAVFRAAGTLSRSTS